MSVSVGRVARQIGRRGFTLIEVLIATALTLLLMAAVVRLLASVTTSVADSRAVIEITQQLQSAQVQLQNDLRYATARGAPPFGPADQKGYLEIIEGPGPFAITGLGTKPIKLGETNALGAPLLDTSVGDMDDILMMTVRSFGEPFYGRWVDPSTNVSVMIQSQDAEIAWFVRGNKLHRRVRLIAPGRQMQSARLAGQASVGDLIGFDSTARTTYARNNDVAARLDLSYGDRRLGLGPAFGPSFNVFTASSLGDLTKRENRFGHDPFAYPHDVRFWGAAGLPTHGDTSHVGDPSATTPVPQAGPWTEPLPWGFFGDDPLGVPGSPDFHGYHIATDYWRAPFQNLDLSGNLLASPIIDSTTGALVEYQSTSPNNTSRTLTGAIYINSDSTSLDAQFSRFGEDVILDNVIGFDIKVWDPGAPVFVEDGRVVKPGDPGCLGVLNSWITAGENQNAANFARFGAYVDLYYTRGSAVPSQSHFAGPGIGALRAGAPGIAAIYDTGSNHYESDGIDQFGDGLLDLAFDGLDNDNDGVIDDISERETFVPYPVPLRSLQIKIRVFEGDSQQVREVTVSHDLVD
ncbi:MAG: prepilin-type N-terminal cleavage/methylation domain-containing protein [Pirellulales bacterium]|nr:prepilin-type N-terminal cleavage/methylation domain-containing protein [Pirellulales bacterium]